MKKSPLAFQFQTKEAWRVAVEVKWRLQLRILILHSFKKGERVLELVIMMKTTIIITATKIDAFWIELLLQYALVIRLLFATLVRFKTG